MPAARPPRQKRRPSLLATIRAWCTDGVRATALFAHGRPSPVQPSDVAADAGPSGEAPELPRYSYDASLLFRRMAALQVDRDELVSDDPLLFRELQALCTLCRSKERCVLDLAQEGDERANREWREYCLNATTLNALGAVQNCARAAIPAEAAFHRLLGRRVIGSGQARNARDAYNTNGC